jgi:hypothetical protein
MIAAGLCGGQDSLRDVALTKPDQSNQSFLNNH